MILEGNGAVGRESLFLDWDRQRFFERLRAVWGSRDVARPLRPEESPAPPVSRVVPWTPAAAASFFGAGTLIGVIRPLPVGVLER